MDKDPEKLNVTTAMLKHPVVTAFTYVSGAMAGVVDAWLSGLQESGWREMCQSMGWHVPFALATFLSGLWMTLVISIRGLLNTDLFGAKPRDHKEQP